MKRQAQFWRSSKSANQAQCIESQLCPAQAFHCHVICAVKRSAGNLLVYIVEFHTRNMQDGDGIIIVRAALKILVT